MILNIPEMVAERVALQLGGEGLVEIEPRPIDDEEDERLREFRQRGCGCTVLKNGPCSTQFTLDHYRTVRANCAELSWGELNMALMGQLMALTSDLENGSHPAERESEVLHATFTVASEFAGIPFASCMALAHIDSRPSGTLPCQWSGVQEAWQHWTCSPQCSVA